MIKPYDWKIIRDQKRYSIQKYFIRIMMEDQNLKDLLPQC